VSDTLVGRNTVDTLLNKTLTAPILSAPAINGVVTTTGLTLPAFTAGGTITGSGSPIMTGFGAINGLSLSSSTIEPAEPGNLTVRAHGTHTLTLDTGVGGAISLGSANASGLNVGHSSSTFTLSGNFDQSGSSGSFKTGSGAITLNGDTTLASGKSLIITTADNLLVGGSKVLQTIPIRVPLTALIANQTIFIADATYQLSDVKCLPSALSLSGSMQVTVDTGTGGVGSGINQLTSSLSLSGLINTVVSGNLISTPTLIQPGDRVSVTFGGILTGLTGNCMVYVKRV
jgi:hypothetical protein